MKRPLCTTLLALALPLAAAAPALRDDPLPPPVIAALAQAGLPDDALAAIAMPGTGAPPLPQGATPPLPPCRSVITKSAQDP